MYVKELDMFLTLKVLDNTPAVLSLGKLCDENGYTYEWINGQKPHLIKNGIRIQCNTENFVPIVVPGLSTSSSSGSYQSTSRTPSRQESHCSLHFLQARLRHRQQHQVIMRLENEKIELKATPLHCKCQLRLMIDQGNLMKPKAIILQKTTKKETTIELGNPLCSDIPEWLQGFREILVDDGVLERGDSLASSSHEPSLEPTRSVDLGKHSVYTHFPKDRNCEICQRTKITRAPCRRRNGGAVPRAENFGDLITADHKVLSENCESRNNHRYAVVVEDLAIQWIQSYPCKAKTSQETQGSLQKVLGA